MSNKDDLITLTGKIDEVLPNNTFRVKIDNMDHMILCYMSGRLKQNKIKVIMGDNVKVEVSTYDLTKGRIVYRL
jgi:translation initiation factor IF-1